MHGQAEIHHMITHSGHDFHRTVCEHIDLHNLMLPEAVAHDMVANTCQRLFGKLARDGARGYNQVATVFGMFHDASLAVDKIVVAVVGLDPDDRHALRKRDADMAVVRLIALSLGDVGTTAQGFLDGPHINGIHLLGQGVELLPLEHLLDLVHIEEALGYILSNVYLHLGTHIMVGHRLVERHHRHQQIAGHHHIDGNHKCLLPIEFYGHRYSVKRGWFIASHARSSSGSLAFNMRVISGTILSRSPAPNTTSTSKEWLRT